MLAIPMSESRDISTSPGQLSHRRVLVEMIKEDLTTDLAQSDSALRIEQFIQDHPFSVVCALEQTGMLVLGAGAVIDNDN